MKSNVSAKPSGSGSSRNWAILVTCVFTALVSAGSLSLSGCARTESGLARETALYLVTSNTVTGLKTIVPYAPPPVGNLLEGILAAGGALLALWATHLHRSVAEIKNGHAGKANGPRPAPIRSG